MIKVDANFKGENNIMYPYLFKIGPFQAGTYGLMLALGFLTALYLLKKEFTRKNINPDYAYSIIFAGLIGGILGAKINFLIEHWQDVVADPAGMIFTGNGLTWYGGLIGGAVAVILTIHQKKLQLLPTIDLLAPLLALGYVFGRMGCQLAGDGDYGVPSKLPWAMSYPNGLVPTLERVHPTPIYEMLAFLVIFFILWNMRKSLRPPGFIFNLYLIFAGIERLLVEFLRLNTPVLWGLTEAQLVSIVMILGGSLWLLKLKLKDNLTTFVYPKIKTH